MIMAAKISCHYCHQFPVFFIPLTAIISFIYFGASVSFLRVVTFEIAKLCGNSKAKNILVLSVLLIINYLMLFYVSPIIARDRESILANPNISFAHESMFSIESYIKRGEIDRTALFMQACFPSFIR